MKKWAWQGAGISLVISVVSIVFSGGGHGWGTDLLYYAFWPISVYVAQLDRTWRISYMSAHPQTDYPPLGVESIVVIGFVALFCLWGAALGALAYKTQERFFVKN